MVFEKLLKIFWKEEIPTEYAAEDVSEDEKIIQEMASFGQMPRKKDAEQKIRLVALKDAKGLDRVRFLMDDYPLILIRVTHVRDKKSLKIALSALRLAVAQKRAKLVALDDNWLVVAAERVGVDKLKTREEELEDERIEETNRKKTAARIPTTDPSKLVEDDEPETIIHEDAEEDAAVSEEEKKK